MAPKKKQPIQSKHWTSDYHTYTLIPRDSTDKTQKDMEIYVEGKKEYVVKLIYFEGKTSAEIKLLKEMRATSDAIREANKRIVEVKIAIEQDKQDIIIADAKNEMNKVKKERTKAPHKQKTIVKHNTRGNGLITVNEDSHDIIKRGVPTGKFICPQCFVKLADIAAVIEHHEKTKHEGDFRIFEDPSTGQLFFLTDKGRTLNPLDEFGNKPKESVLTTIPKGVK